MAGKRKRKRPNKSLGLGSSEKRQKISNPTKTIASRDSVVKQALLSQFYPEVLTLREYLLSRLPTTSKIRRKKVLYVGTVKDSEACANSSLSTFLDRTLVGATKSKDAKREDRWRHWAAFSQRVDDSISTLIDLNSIGKFSQSDIVDFAIWLLFSRGNTISGRVQHLLCQGYQRDANSRMMNRAENAPNNHVSTIKSDPWPQVLLLMGNEGEKMMLDLLLDCGLFVEVTNGCETYHQLSGLPLNDLQTLPESTGGKAGSPLEAVSRPASAVEHSPSNINFVRSRMLYARASLNAQGGVRFGFRHILASNHQLKEQRSAPPPTQTDPSTIHIMMYLFPRQFGLHNAFTGKVDHRQTVQPFKDYTLREDEINEKYPQERQRKIPKRLRGMAVGLVQKLQIQHQRCAYKKLLEYYCPVISSTPRFPLPPTLDHVAKDSSTLLRTQNTIASTRSPLKKSRSMDNSKEDTSKAPSMMSHATPSSMVSAFCRSVLSTLIPRRFWGAGETQKSNEKIFLRNVHRFIELRRFESLSLHEVAQGIQISSIEWLQSPNCVNNKSSKSDTKKKLEIFLEFLYYFFDSLLIPLIRANFHVTESNVHKYRMFYYRHDVWRSLVEPAIATLKITMFEEVELEKARKLLNSRKLGFSQVRLLPKETGVRPIVNLKRRPVKPGSKLLGSSINTILAPVYNAFTYEKSLDPTRFGATLFSVGDLYTRLKAFQTKISNSSKPLYFVKVDVKAAFDTIPQASVIELMSSLSSKPAYRISKHVEIKPGENYREDLPGKRKAKPMRKWAALARGAKDPMTFEDTLKNNLAVGKKNTIFVDNIINQYRSADDLLDLLSEHVTRNMVKIGKKFYRQKEGIPQGSVLSSLLCNYFYADLEAQHLGFLNENDSLLLRLIDDFLLITTSHTQARLFLQKMHDGVPAYGVQVNPAKTLVNFEATVNNQKVARLVGTRAFPYCGAFIDTKSLDISRDRERRKDIGMLMSLVLLRGLGELVANCYSGRGFFDD
ncbi:hypothetical protein GLAREA_04977 [Glarea lozoyensis ATCC 20868]|uniref:Telomerase reverse transcriptase n=1 Tax=Glarea lozoyensis (strain ATCC 20868 / MF5171) TaxID=1116229 RepID=S3D847_GLAL2|nr:uncharacterized protein GLAREA_04977 [Glarea lozoyensis ATCC 20868]EPE28186.1 hypothetical protein GLAREA_04977 [Glarea lozoyensis ATCC 20868]